MKHLRLLFILLLVNMNSMLWARPITQMIYEDVKNKKCLELSPNEIKDIKAICNSSGSYQSQAVKKLSLDEITEQTVFSKLLDDEIQKAECAKSQQEWILAHRDVLSKMILSTCEKIPQLKTNLLEIEKLNQKINGLKKTIDGTVRLVPKADRLKAEKEIQKLEKTKSLYAADIENIKETQVLFKSTGLFQEISKQLNGEGVLTLEKSANQSCDFLKKNVKTILKDNLKKMKETLSDLKDSQKSQKISSNLKTQLWQSSSGFEIRSQIQKSESSLLKNGLICRMESRYGEGVKIRNDLINIGTMALGGASFFSGRLVSELAAMNLSKPVLIGRTMVAAEAATEVSLAVYTANQQCQTKLTPTIKNTCDISEKTIQAQLDQNECLYAIASGMLATGFTALGVKQAYKKTPLPQSEPYVVKLSEEEIKANPQIAIWQYKEAGQISEANNLRKKYQDQMKNKPFKIDAMIGKGSTGPKYIEFEDGTKGIWKPVKDPYNNIAGKEVAAFKIDQYLEVDQMPLTVERELNGQKGMVQLRINELDEHIYYKNPPNYAFMDSLIGNEDRLISDDVLSYQRRPIAVDYEQGFRNLSKNRSTDFDRDVGDVNHQLRFAETESEKRIALARLKSILPSRSSYEKLKFTNEEQWTKMLQNQINPYQINSFLENRKRIVDLIDKQRDLHGEDIFRDGVLSPLMPVKQLINKEK